MAKKVQIDIEVNSQSVVQAKDNVDGLNQSIQNTETTTKDFGKSVKIEYDKAGNATDVFIDKNMSLTKQIRAVKAQMEILTATGKANSQEFTILQRKFNDLNDNLARNKARSQELFGTLSLLPGPVGTFAASLQGGIDLLKTFSGVKLSDLKNQFKALGDDLKEIFRGFSEFSSKPIQTPVAPGQTTTTGTAPTATGTNNVEQINTALEKRAEVLRKINIETGKGVTITGAYDQSTQSAVTSTENMSKASYQAKTALQNQKIATDELTAAETILTTASTILKAALAALGIGLLISLISSGLPYLKKMWDYMTGLTTETEKNVAATNAFTEALKREKDALDSDLQAIDAGLKARQTRAKIAGQSEKEIADMAIKAGQDKLEALRELDNTLFKEQDDLRKRKDLTNEQSAKLNKDINDRLLQNNKDIIKQIMDNEQTSLDARLANQQSYYQKRLAELDAAIQLEIDKDETSGEKLASLQKQRQDMVIAHEKLGANQRQLLREQDKKKKEDALKEDQQRVEAFQAKEDDFRIAAIKDAQTREEDARTKKLNQDILALDYDKEYAKKSTEEKNEILKNLEEAYQLDLTKIRETYFLKKLQQIDEEKTFEIQQLALKNKNKLDANQLELQQDKDHYQLLHWNLNEYYKQRFIDMNLAAKTEHDNTEYQLNSELLQIETAHENKKLTDEEYANKKKEINKRIAENDQQLVDKQKELDRTLLEAKKETAAATMNIAENLVGLLSALGEFSTDWQITAAIAEAGLGIAKIIIATQTSIAEFSAAVAGLGPVGVAMASAYAIKQKIAAGLGIAAITVGAIGRINQIKGQAGSSTGTGEAPQPNMGKNYGDGGMIDGPRHAQGGVPINAEGGEAIMTRNAVTMFRPLLSMLNQAGGGTSFSRGAVGQANFDNPKSQTNSLIETPVIKTYIVESELTTIQHKHARLKDLSTL